MSGIRKDSGFFRRMEEVQKEVVKKRVASRKKNAAEKKAAIPESSAPLMVGDGLSEKSPEGELPPLGDLRAALLGLSYVLAGNPRTLFSESIRGSVFQARRNLRMPLMRLTLMTTWMKFSSG